MVSDKIKIKDVLNESLNTREAAVRLFEIYEMKPNTIVEVDFESIEFMSRSFADQFYKESKKLEKDKDVKILISNAVEPIKKMLKKVAETQNKIDRDYEVLPVYSYNSKSALTDYLLSI